MSHVCGACGCGGGRAEIPTREEDIDIDLASYEESDGPRHEQEDGSREEEEEELSRL